LKQGDVIIAMDGKPVKDGDDLVARVAETPVGQTVNLRYVRDKKEQDTKLVIGDRSQVFADQLGSAEEEPSGGSRGTDARFGISIQNLTPDIASRLGIDSKGVLVTSVDADSFAEEVGLQRGDVIMEINHQAINKVDDVLRIQRGITPKSDVVFLVQRNQGGNMTTLYLAGTLQ
jgi:serine protease Do